MKTNTTEMLTIKNSVYIRTPKTVYAQTQFAMCNKNGELILTQIIKRGEALKLGMRTFFSNSQCSNGHNAMRFTRNYNCCECHRLANKQRRITEKGTK